MEETKAKVFYVEKEHFKEAMMTFSFRREIDWTEEGMSLLSWSYTKVAETKELDPDKIYKKMRRWNGNKRSKLAGHRTISVGDIVVIGDNVRLVTGYGWAKVPDIIWKKVIKN